MTAARLCQLCQSIPLNNLLPFPDSSYGRTLTGYKYLTRLIHRKSMKHDPVPDTIGFHHHPSLESLRTSAADCELCRLIETQADALLADAAHQAAKWAAFPDVRTLPGDPSFDLWVTARGEGGDGFWVVARSVSKPGEVLFPIATFGFCAEDDSPLAKALPGRPIIGPPSNETLDRIALWVDETNNHEDCLRDDPPLPTRVVDVAGPSHPAIVTVVEPEEGTTAAYTALSYCWGNVANPYTTTRSLLDERKKGIDVTELPRTFRDAIEVTRKLGVRYIWIDSLCICQDDAQDWERESARMAAVYSNAYLAISATGSQDTSGGLFFDRPGRPYLRMALEQNTVNPSGDMLVFPLDMDKEVIREHRVEMRDQPLGMRGWAFQERLLARRVLHFASDQVSFESPQGTVFEDGLRLPDRYSYVNENDEKLTRHRGAEAKDREDSGSLLDRWHWLLTMYGDRKLTFPEDSFPALSGIAKVFSGLLDDEYVAGLWRKSLVEGLCWQSMNCKAIEKYRAPSWSWASVDGMTSTGLLDNHCKVASVLDYHVEVDGDNPFGRVKDGWLKIEGPLVPLELSETTGPTGYMRMKTAGGNTQGPICGFDTLDSNLAVSGDAVGRMRLFALVLLGFVSSGEREGGAEAGEVDAYMCLVVRESEREDVVSGAMERIAWIIYRPEDFGAGDLEARTTVTLV